MNLPVNLTSRSLLLRLALAMGAIALLALLSITSSSIFAEMTTGKAAAINLSGSLRMQSYLIARHISAAERDRAALWRSMEEFDHRLTHSSLVGSLPSAADDPLRRAYNQVDRRWRDTLRPQAVVVAESGDAAARSAYLAQVEPFVAEVDHLVKLLEQDVERRIETLRLVQGISLFLTIVVVFVTMFLAHTQAVIPLADLVAAARGVQRRDFAVRVAHTGTDELGQVGAAFNLMVEELSRSYADLEARVAEKTAELEQRNQSLELLYNTTQTLSHGQVTNDTLNQVLADIERVVGLSAGVVCARQHDQSQGFPIAFNPAQDDGQPALCSKTRCDECFGDGRLKELVLRGGSHMLSIPLSENGRQSGVMPLEMPAGRSLQPWQMQLLETVGRHVGAALEANRTQEERHRAALLEERSVIARELHDSLAQSLSYLKIQVLRLQTLLDRGGSGDDAALVVQELRDGLNSAYRQLRELLTTFRLRMDGRGLRAALEDTVADFRQRNPLSVALDNQLLGPELSANEEIHVLQIVREALSNVEHHAHAQTVHISLQSQVDDSRAHHVTVRIDDDGNGLTQAGSPRHHYGLAIMADRAQSLGGNLQITPRPEGGVRVELQFVATTPFQAAPNPRQPDPQPE